jgi:SSS family solute:Na+ symporter
MILVAASTLIANDILRGLRPQTSDETVALVARCCVPIGALVAVGFALAGGQTIVALLLMGYSFVTQLFPGLVCSLMRNNPATKTGVFCGIVVGVATVAAITLSHSTFRSLLPFLPIEMNDINVGFVAFLLNVIVTAGVSMATRSAATSASVRRA